MWPAIPIGAGICLDTALLLGFLAGFVGFLDCSRRCSISLTGFTGFSVGRHRSAGVDVAFRFAVSSQYTTISLHGGIPDRDSHGSGEWA